MGRNGPKCKLMLSVIAAAIPVFSKAGDNLADLLEGLLAENSFSVGLQHLVWVEGHGPDGLSMFSAAFPLLRETLQVMHEGFFFPCAGFIERPAPSELRSHFPNIGFRHDLNIRMMPMARASQIRSMRR